MQFGSVVFKAAALLLLGFVIVSTLGPPSARPHLPFGRDLEHVGAFALLAFVFLLAFPQRRWTVILWALALPLLLELGQLVAPGRHAYFRDLLVNWFGSLVGLVLATLCRRLIASWRGTDA